MNAKPILASKFRIQEQNKNYAFFWHFETNYLKFINLLGKAYEHANFSIIGLKNATQGLKHMLYYLTFMDYNWCLVWPSNAKEKAKIFF